MKIKQKLNLGITFGIIVLFITITFILATTLTIFSNGLGIGNITFAGNENHTINISVSRYANFTSAFLNLSGYNDTSNSYPSNVTIKINNTEIWNYNSTITNLTLIPNNTIKTNLTLYYDFENTLNDSIGRCNLSSRDAGPFFNETIKINGSYSRYYTTAKDVGDNCTEDIIAAHTNNFTIAFWINKTSTNPSVPMMTGPGDWISEGCWGIGLNYNNVQFAKDGAGILGTSDVKLNDSNWHRIVITRNSSNGFKLYVDKVLKNEGYDTIDFTGNVIYIGSGNAYENSGISGYIDGVQFYNGYMYNIQDIINDYNNFTNYSNQYFNFFNSKTLNFSSVLNTAINHSTCDCSGCVLVGDNCSIPLTFHSDTAGIVQYNDLQGNYNLTHNIVGNSTTPLNNSYHNSNQNFTVNISSVNQLNNATLNIYNSSSIVNQTTYTFGASKYEVLIGYAVSLVDEIYTWFWNIFDSTNNNVLTENRTMTMDTIYPNVSFNPSTDYNNSLLLRNNIFINITTIEKNFKNSTFYLTNGIGYSNYSYNLTNSNSSMNFTNLADGNYTFNVTSCDLASNCNFTETRIVILDSTKPSIILSIPNDFNSTTNRNVNFEVNTSSINYGLKNISIFVYNYSNYLIYSSNKEISGISNFSTFLSSFSNGNYRWNATSCKTNNLCNFSKTNSFSIYGKSYNLSSLQLSSNGFLENASLNLITDYPSNNLLSYCNFTLTQPNGYNLINNINGTRINNTFWNSTSMVLNLTGIYNQSVSCLDEYGNNYSFSNQINIGYNLFFNTPTNISIVAVVSKTDTQTLKFDVYDDSNATIFLSLTSNITQEGNFTFNNSFGNITFDSKDNNTNLYSFTWTFNASNSIGAGNYSGYINLSNSTYGVNKNIYFIYRINPPSGLITIYDSSEHVCNNSDNSYCYYNNSIRNGQSSVATYTIKNTGFFQLKGCSIKMTNGNLNKSWSSFIPSSFNLDVRESKQISVVFSPISESTGTYDDYLYIHCDSSDIADDPTDGNSSNYPRIVLDILPSLSSPPSGGGGGGEGTKIPVIGLENINSSKSYNELERSIIFSSINNYCSVKLTKTPLAIADFHETCSLESEDLKEIAVSLSKIGVSITDSDLNKFYENYKSGKLIQYSATESEVDKYNLYQSILGVVNALKFDISSISKPKIINTNQEFIVRERITANKLLKSCETISNTPSLTCYVENYSVFVEYRISDTNFLSKVFSGTIRVITSASPDNIETKNIPITFSVYNIGYSILNVPVWIIALIIATILLIIIIVYYNYRKKRRKSNIFELGK